MFCKVPWWKRKIQGFAFKLFNIFDENWNADFNSNGERYIIEALFRRWSKEKIHVVIFDVGAYRGAYLEMLLATAKKFNLSCEFHAFEPQKVCYVELVRKFGAFKNFHLNNVGISDVDGELSLWYEEDKRSQASSYIKTKNSTEEKIKVIRLDKYIEENKIGKIDFIKIDTEGNDYKVLLSLGDYLQPSFISFIQFEYGEVYIYSRNTLFDFYNLLSSRGYVIGKIRRCGIEVREWHPKFENFMYSNYIAFDRAILAKYQ